MWAWLKSLYKSPARSGEEIETLIAAIEVLIRDLRYEEKILKDRIENLEQLITKEDE